MFARLDSIISKVFLWGLPVVVLMAIAMTYINQDDIASLPPYIQTLHGLAGLLFGLWMAFSLYISARLVVSKKQRNAILAKLVFLREKDEREAFLTGNATKVSFLVTLSILILLLCLNTFHFSFYQVPAEQAPHGKNKSINLSISFNLLDDDTETAKVNASEGRTYFINYTGLPISKTAIILSLIIWQILSYNYLMKRLSEPGADSYDPM